MQGLLKRCESLVEKKPRFDLTKRGKLIYSCLEKLLKS